MKSMNKTGSIIILNNKKGVFPKLVRFFTRSSFSHVAITLGKIIPNSESVLTAEGSGITVHPLKRYYENKNYDFSIYELKVATEKELQQLTLNMYEKDVYKPYAFFQNLWFIYRWFVEFFGMDVRKQGNWFPNNSICSEHGYQLLMMVAKLKNLKDLEKKLNEWNSNCFSPEDCFQVIKQFPQYFIKK